MYTRLPFIKLFVKRQIDLLEVRFSKVIYILKMNYATLVSSLLSNDGINPSSSMVSTNVSLVSSLVDCLLIGLIWYREYQP